MGDRGIGFVQALQFVVAQPDAVAEHGAFPAETVVVVDVEIGTALGEQFP